MRSRDSAKWASKLAWCSKGFLGFLKEQAGEYLASGVKRNIISELGNLFENSIIVTLLFEIVETLYVTIGMAE